MSSLKYKGRKKGELIIYEWDMELCKRILEILYIHRYVKGGPPTHSSFERVCMQLHPPPNAMPVMEALDHGLLLETQRNPKSKAASGQHEYRAHSIY